MAWILVRNPTDRSAVEIWADSRLKRGEPVYFYAVMREDYLADVLEGDLVTRLADRENVVMVSRSEWEDLVQREEAQGEHIRELECQIVDLEYALGRAETKIRKYM